MAYTKRPPYLLPAIAAGALLLLSIAAFHSYLPYTGKNLTPKEPPAVILAMDNTYFVGLGKNGKLWSLNARKVELSRNRSTTVLSGITDGRVFDDGKVVLKVKAGRAVYDTVSRGLLLNGGVIIDGSNGQSVSADGASWNSSTMILRSIGKVGFRTRWTKVSADNLLVDLRSQEMSMRGGHGVIYLKSVEAGM